MRCTFLPKCGRSTKIEIQIVILGDSFQENSETFWVFFKYWGEHLSGAGIGWKGNCRLCRHASISTPIWAPLPRKFLPLTRHLRWDSLFLTLLKHVWISLCVCAFRFLYLLSLIGFDDEKHMAFEPSMPHAKSNIWTVFYAWNPEVNKRPNNFYANKTTLFSVVHFFFAPERQTQKVLLPVKTTSFRNANIGEVICWWQKTIGYLHNTLEEKNKAKNLRKLVALSWKMPKYQSRQCVAISSYIFFLQ